MGTEAAPQNRVVRGLPTLIKTSKGAIKVSDQNADGSLTVSRAKFTAVAVGPIQLPGSGGQPFYPASGSYIRNIENSPQSASGGTISSSVVTGKVKCFTPSPTIRDRVMVVMGSCNLFDNGIRDTTFGTTCFFAVETKNGLTEFGAPATTYPNNGGGPDSAGAGMPLPAVEFYDPWVATRFGRDDSEDAVDTESEIGYEEAMTELDSAEAEEGESYEDYESPAPAAPAVVVPEPVESDGGSLNNNGGRPNKKDKGGTTKPTGLFGGRPAAPAEADAPKPNKPSKPAKPEKPVQEELFLPYPSAGEQNYAPGLAVDGTFAFLVFETNNSPETVCSDLNPDDSLFSDSAIIEEGRVIFK